MPPETAEVVVLGAGIAGCALAYHLLRRGIGPVVVYDPRTPAAGASGRAAGIVTEQLWNSWDVEVTRASKTEYAALARRRDPSAYATNGFARWTRSTVAAAALEEVVDRLKGWNVEVERLDAAALSRRVPGGRFENVLGGIWSAGDGIVAPSTMTEIYAAEAREGGAEFWLGTPFGSLRLSDGRWLLEGAGRTVRAHRAVVAAGAWSKPLLRSIGHLAPLIPYRTQAALLRPARQEDRIFPSVHDIDSDVYVRPESNGRILAGDGTELLEVDPETFRSGGDDSFVAHLAESFELQFPSWADAEVVRAWAGVCTATPDRRPLVGPSPALPGLFLMTGFNGFGVMRAGGVAQRLANVLAAGDGPTPALTQLDPVRPARFGPNPPVFAPHPGFTLEGGSDPRF